MYIELSPDSSTSIRHVSMDLCLNPYLILKFFDNINWVSLFESKVPYFETGGDVRLDEEFEYRLQR